MNKRTNGYSLVMNLNESSSSSSLKPSLSVHMFEIWWLESIFFCIHPIHSIRDNDDDDDSFFPPFQLKEKIFLQKKNLMYNKIKKIVIIIHTYAVCVSIIGLSWWMESKRMCHSIVTTRRQKIDYFRL